MTMECAHEASGERFAGSPTGFRRLTPGLLKVDRVAESFAGMPDGVTMHGAEGPSVCKRTLAYCTQCCGWA